MNSSSSSESVSPQNLFLTCWSEEVETDLGLNEMGGRIGPAEIAVGTTIDKHERARWYDADSDDLLFVGLFVGLLPAAIEAHEDEGGCGFFFCSSCLVTGASSSLSTSLSLS